MDIDLPYINKNYDGAIAQEAILGVKFSNKKFLLKSFLDKLKIPYKESELSETPYGLGIILDESEDKKIT